MAGTLKITLMTEQRVTFPNKSFSACDVISLSRSLSLSRRSSLSRGGSAHVLCDSREKERESVCTKFHYLHISQCIVLREILSRVHFGVRKLHMSFAYAEEREREQRASGLRTTYYSYYSSLFSRAEKRMQMEIDEREKIHTTTTTTTSEST
jgi:hypothetical protein